MFLGKQNSGNSYYFFVWTNKIYFTNLWVLLCLCVADGQGNATLFSNWSHGYTHRHEHSDGRWFQIVKGSVQNPTNPQMFGVDFCKWLWKLRDGWESSCPLENTPLEEGLPIARVPRAPQPGCCSLTVPRFPAGWYVGAAMCTPVTRQVQCKRSMMRMGDLDNGSVSFAHCTFAA